MLAHLLLFIFVIKIEAEFKLVFSDEFNNLDSIDQNIWDIEHEDKSCNGNYVSQLNCKTNGRRNLQIFNGTLVLAAIREIYADKEYTSPLITTKQNFTYGRFEIRAALPNGKMLRPAIYLIPTFNSRTTADPWSKDGQIVFMDNTQDNHLNQGIHYSIHHNMNYTGERPLVTEDLNDFHNYSFEWSKTQMSWTFDNQLQTTYKIKDVLGDNYNPFDKPFKLVLNLGVGGIFFPGQTLTQQNANQWKCPLLVLDYVRVYQDTEQNINKQKLPGQNKITSTEICNTIMPLIRNTDLIEENKTIDSNNNYNYNLIFFDEFNDSNSIDPSKWDVQHEDKYCDGNYIEQINCKINSTNNLQIINGTLVLAAIRQKHLNREYTSPLITTKKSFTYGKFEIRAALPKGKMLRTAISLVSTITGGKEGEVWSTNGQVDILVHQQDQLLVHGLHGTKNNNKEHKFVPGNELVVTENLNNFHIYEMEWSNNWMTWSFDRKLLTTKSVTQEFENNPFDKPFKLRIILGVGGEKSFPHQTLTPQDSKNWDCSLLILDYVRVYQRSEQNSIVRDMPRENSISSVDICDNVMKLVRNISLQTDNIDGKTPQPNPSTNNNKIVTIIAISSFLLLLAIIPLIIYMFIRIKKSGHELNSGQPHYKNDTGIDSYGEGNPFNDLYSDACESIELYDNVYSPIQSQQIQPDYIQMTNKYK